VVLLCRMLKVRHISTKSCASTIILARVRNRSACAVYAGLYEFGCASVYIYIYTKLI
jgi:hypothetical protein